MRGATPQLASPYPIVTLLPAVFQEDPTVVRLTAGLDDVLSAVIATLDCLDAYLDPALTPEDFLGWLGGWVGVTLPDGWPADRKRVTVARAVQLYRSRGTVAGLREQVEVVTGGQVEVIDSGGVSWSVTPTDPDPTDGPWLHVRVSDADESTDASTVDSVVAAAKPAHVPHTVVLEG